MRVPGARVLPVLPAAGVSASTAAIGWRPQAGEFVQMSFHAPQGAAWHNLGKGRTVLVTDDDRTVRTVLSRMLQADGYRVLEADRAERCLLHCMEKQVDAFLLDLHLPGMDGTALCRRIREMERYRFTPIICITVADEERSIGPAFEAGADDFIAKPVNALTLKARLAGRIQKTEHTREMEQVRTSLSRYISRRTQSMVAAYSMTGVLPTPEEQDVCILFSDVRGFTQLSQELEPTVLFNALSAQLGMQVDAVYRHGGYVDKFAGDGIMAVFDSQDRLREACACALEIMDTTHQKSTADSTWILQLGIGIHAGRALVGNIGSDKHLDFTVIGETVNLAARLCGCAEPMSIVVSDSARQQLADDSGLAFTASRAVNIRGVRQPVTVHSLSRRSV